MGYGSGPRDLRDFLGEFEWHRPKFRSFTSSSSSSSLSSFFFFTIQSFLLGSLAADRTGNEDTAVLGSGVCVLVVEG